MPADYARKAEGISVITMPAGGSIERKTATCAHCDRIVYVQPGTDGTAPLSRPDPIMEAPGNAPEPPSVCHVCWALVCPRCHATGECKPLEKRLAQLEARDRFLRSAGL